MYQEFFSQWNEKAKNSFTPFIEFNQLFTRTAERLTRQNIEVANEFFSKNIEQLVTFKDAKCAEDIIQLQSKFVNSINERVLSNTQQALDLVSATTKEYQSWLEKYGFEPLNKAQTLQTVETKSNNNNNKASSKKTAA